MDNKPNTTATVQANVLDVLKTQTKTQASEPVASEPVASKPQDKPQGNSCVVYLPNQFIVREGKQTISNDIVAMNQDAVDGLIHSALMCFLQNRTYSDNGKTKTKLSEFAPHRAIRQAKAINAQAVGNAIVNSQLKIEDLINVLIQNSKTGLLDLVTITKQLQDAMKQQ